MSALISVALLGGLLAAPASTSSTSEVPSEPPPDELGPPGSESPDVDPPSGEPSRFGDHASANLFGIDVSMNGYLRFAAELIENDPGAPFVGVGDGFKLANARFGLRLEKERMLGYISLEGAVGEGAGLNDPNEELRVRLRDAYLRFRLSRFAQVTAGRFKAPYDLGSLKATVRRTFIDRPLESRGVRAAQGYEQEGLSQGRQLGLMVHADRVGFSEDGFDLGYALALTNGRTGDRLLNDNDTPAAFGRVVLHYGSNLSVAGAGFVDGRSRGELPDVFDEEVYGLEGSVVAEFWWIYLEGQFLFQRTSFPTTGQPELSALGFHAQASIELGDFEVGYRYAFFEPNSDDLADADQVAEHTASILYRFGAYPVAVFINGTLAEEQSGRTLSNNRLAAMLQMVF